MGVGRGVVKMGVARGVEMGVAVTFTMLEGDGEGQSPEPIGLQMGVARGVEMGVAVTFTMLEGDGEGQSPKPVGLQRSPEQHLNPG